MMLMKRKWIGKGDLSEIDALPAYNLINIFEDSNILLPFFRPD